MLRGCLFWGIPIAILVISPERHFVIVWPTVLLFMGVACLLNARRCGCIHCYATGPFFLLLAALGLLYGIGVLPLGARGWSALSLALIVGSAVLTCVPEWILGRYRLRTRLPAHRNVEKNCDFDDLCAPSCPAIGSFQLRA